MAKEMVRNGLSSSEIPNFLQSRLSSKDADAFDTPRRYSKNVPEVGTRGPKHANMFFQRVSMNGVALENGKVMTPRPLAMHEMITMDVIEKQYPRSSRLKSRLKQKEEEALKSEVGAMKSMIESLGIEEAAGDHLKPHEILGQTLWRARRGSDPKVIDALGKILLGARQLLKKPNKCSAILCVATVSLCLAGDGAKPRQHDPEHEFEVGA